MIFRQRYSRVYPKLVSMAANNEIQRNTNPITAAPTFASVVQKYDLRLNIKYNLHNVCEIQIDQNGLNLI